MALPTARLSLTGSVLTIAGEAGSPLFDPERKIYFLNVLNFSLPEKRHGYEAAAETVRPKNLAEIIEYLKEQGFEVKFDRAIDDALVKLRTDVEKLKYAKLVGHQLKKRHISSISIPKFKRQLKPYQIPAVVHMAELPHAANFSVPGSGKTTIALAAFAFLRWKRMIDALIVVGPRASFAPWEEEFKGCFGRSPRATRIVGSRRVRSRLYREAENNELTILTYQMAAMDVRDIHRLLRKRRIMLVLDESHNIKRIEGGVWSSALQDLSAFAEKRVILTGTPAPNSLLDLWSQMTFLWPNPPVLDSSQRYKDRIENRSNALEEVKKDIFPLYWRIKKKDLKLAWPRLHTVRVPMRQYQSAIYGALAAKVLADAVKAPNDRLKLRPWRKARMVRLLQTSSNPTLLAEYSSEFRIPPIDASGLAVDQLISRYSDYETPPKLDVCMDLARKLVKKGEKVLIWSSFVHNIRTLGRLLSDLDPAIVYGDIPRDDTEDEFYNRERMIDKFKTSNACSVLLANPAACAESVSLHRICRHAIYIDRTFNCAQYMQSLDRIHRIGLDQKVRVHYYFLIAEQSVDNVVDERLKVKQRRMLELLDDDLAILDLESKAEEISEESEEEKDFEEIIKHLKGVQRVGA